MKFKKFFGFLTLFAALSLNIGNNEKEKKINNNLFSEKQSLQQIEKKARVVFSYEDIFSNYYQKFSDSMLKNDIENPYTYDEYKNGFYTFNMNIDDYNDFLLSEAKGLINISDYETNTTSSSSYDADYILKGDISNPDSTDFNPNITPTTAFKRKVKYDKFNLQNVINDGDIIYESATILNDIGHTAFVYNKSKQCENTSYANYIQTIEAVSSGVKFGFLDDTRMLTFGVVVLRWTDDTDYINSAKYFMYQQLNKPYSYPLQTGRINLDINSSQWYCSELINAAYHYAYMYFYIHSTSGWINPTDIYNDFSNNNWFVTVSNTFDIKLLGKESGKWKFNVYNNTNSSKNLMYNKKLAFESDAKNFNNLLDVESVNIPARLYVTVKISTNVFATDAAFCYQDLNNKKSITYAHSLNNSTLRCKIFKNIVE